MNSATSIIFLLAVLMVIPMGCKKKEDPEPICTFNLNGVSRTFTHGGQFSRAFCGSSTNCAHFNFDKNNSAILCIQFGIPGDAIVGHTYVNGEYRFVFNYWDEYGVYYDLAKNGECELTLTKWDGPGGWASGVFSGRLLTDGIDSLVITGGTFEARISTE